MAKHIAVFGSPGSGKSVFCAALAKEVVRQKKRTVIVSGDIVVPMLPFFCGDSDTTGLGRLCAGDITPLSLSETVKIINQYPDIGVIGCQFDDYPISITSEQLLSISKWLDDMVDVVIWDGLAEMNCVINQTVLPIADTRVCIVTADTKGILYFENYRHMIRDMGKCILLEGMAKPYTTYEEMSLRVGGFYGRLNYGRDIERICNDGNVFNIDKVCHESYRMEAEKIIGLALKKEE